MKLTHEYICEKLDLKINHRYIRNNREIIMITDKGFMKFTDYNNYDISLLFGDELVEVE